MSTLDLTADIIDVRDIIDRFEELDTDLRIEMETRFEGLVEPEFDEWVRALAASDHPDANPNRCDDASDFETLRTTLEELCGNGGDEQWRGDWYPMTLIADSYMRDYAEELAVDCGMLNADAAWPNNCIDWAEATRQFKQDYASIEIGDVTYWYR